MERERGICSIATARMGLLRLLSDVSPSFPRVRGFICSLDARGHSGSLDK